jgi:hypothetical protein
MRSGRWQSSASPLQFSQVCLADHVSLEHHTVELVSAVVNGAHLLGCLDTLNPGHASTPPHTVDRRLNPFSSVPSPIAQWSAV